MNVLVIGGGGREHALAWKAAQSPLVDTVFCAPGNPGIGLIAKGKRVDINPGESLMLEMFIEANEIGLTIIGPEAPLAAGMADELTEKGHAVFGPSAAAAQLEGSKGFAKDFMLKYGIPTAEYRKFYNASDASAYVQQRDEPLVIKADGLAAGKGVTVAQDMTEAIEAIKIAMLDREFGEAGAKVVIEECLYGEEVSILAFCDGKTAVPMVTSQDHKPVYDDDQGPNTGGMGAYSPTPAVSPKMLEEITQRILQPVIDGMAEEATPYQGILYAGLMITEDGPKVIEYNVRFGDPEAQVVLPRMKSDIIPIFQACRNGTLDGVAIEYDDRPCVTVVMASGGYPKAYEKGKLITGVEDAESDPDVTVFHAGTREEDGKLYTDGGRVLDVTACADDLPAAIAKAYEAVGKIFFEGAHYRKDIGQKALTRLT